MFVAGGAGQDSEAYIIDLKSKKRQRLQAMKQPRNQHSCKRVIINGRDGVIAAGGQSDANSGIRIYPTGISIYLGSCQISIKHCTHLST